MKGSRGIVTTREVASLLGVSLPYVMVLVGQGDLPAPIGWIGQSRIWDRWEVGQAVEAFRARRARPEGYLDVKEITALLGLHSKHSVQTMRTYLPPPEAFDGSKRGRDIPLWSTETAQKFVASYREEHPWGGARTPANGQIKRLPSPLDPETGSHHDIPGSHLPQGQLPKNRLLESMVEDAETYDEFLRHFDAIQFAPIAPEDCFSYELRQFHPRLYAERVFSGQMDGKDYQQHHTAVMTESQFRARLSRRVEKPPRVKQSKKTRPSYGPQPRKHYSNGTLRKDLLPKEISAPASRL